MHEPPLPPSCSTLPLPGVPITHPGSNPIRAFQNFRGTPADESLDLWLADGHWRGRQTCCWEGDRVHFKEEEAFVVLLRGAQWCTRMSTLSLWTSDSRSVQSLVYTLLSVQIAFITLFLIPVWREMSVCTFWSPPFSSPHIDRHTELWFSLLFFISKVTLQRLLQILFLAHLHNNILHLKATLFCSIRVCLCAFDIIR